MHLELKAVKLILATSVVLTCTADIIEISQGKIQGVNHDGYMSYYGIPYAVIDGRFKNAGPAPTWPEPRPVQPASTSCPTSGSEDCLVLDVHVPPGSGPWPVLAWVKGGNTRYYPGLITKEGIVVVNVNYRSGPFGFICLGDESAPGNVGAKDVVLALRWVRDNIVAFRGNPSKVTLGGHGFGAAIVDALTLSPMGQDLFHGIILQSGSVLSPTSFNYDAKTRVFQLAEKFTDNEDLDSVLGGLLDADVDALVEATANLDVPYYPFGLCKEKTLENEETLLASYPIEILKSRNVSKIPMMIGYNSNEGYIFGSFLREINALRRLQGDTKFIVPEEFIFFGESELGQLAKKIKSFYFTRNHTMQALMNYYRDTIFLSHIHRGARLHALAQDKPVYYYEFDHAGNEGVVTDRLKKIGAAHSDELAYLFPENEMNLDDDNGLVQKNLLTLWSNFVNYLNPTQSGEVSWEPLDPNNPRVFVINRDVQMKQFPYTRAMEMWEDYYDKYYYGRRKKP